MRIEQFKIDKYEFKLQSFNAIQYWNICALINGEPMKNYDVLCAILCCENVVLVSTGNPAIPCTPGPLTRNTLDRIASDPETPHDFLTSLYMKLLDYIDSCDKALEASKKK
jgi:hypothetical protein